MIEHKIKVMLVDDHALMREGVASMLRNIEDISVVASVSSGEDAVNQSSVVNPDVILMDIMLRGMTGIEATRWIKEQNSRIKVILLSMEVKKELVTAGIQSGIDGYLPKDIERENLVEGIRAVFRGEKYFNEAITSLIFEDFYHKETGTEKKKRVSKDLTRRENEVLELVATGRTNKEVAEALFISVKTVETHKTNILEKLGLKNTAQLVKYAIKNNLIDLD